MKKSKFVKAFKANWKNILSAVLVGALLIGVVVGVTSLLNKDTKKIPSSAFGVGGIDENGNYEKSDVSIYTKDMFECQGLTIEPDFEATGTYKVFYYDANKNFLGSTDELEATEGVYTKGDDFIVAKYARIMITPGIPVDEDGNVEEDFKIRFYEVVGYANDYTITVNKKQDFKSEKIALSIAHEGGFYGVNSSTFVEQENVNASEIYNIKGFKRINVIVPKAEVTKTIFMQFFDSEGNNLNFDKLYPENTEFVKENDEFYVVDIAIPKGATGFAMVLPVGYSDLYEAYVYN